MTITLSLYLCPSSRITLHLVVLRLCYAYILGLSWQNCFVFYRGVPFLEMVHEPLTPRLRLPPIEDIDPAPFFRSSPFPVDKNLFASRHHPSNPLTTPTEGSPILSMASFSIWGGTTPRCTTPISYNQPGPFLDSCSLPVLNVHQNVFAQYNSRFTSFTFVLI